MGSMTSGLFDFSRRRKAQDGLLAGRTGLPSPQPSPASARGKLRAGEGLLLKWVPHAAAQDFERPKACLVVHLRMAFDPETEIQVIDAACARELDLAQDCERAERALRQCRIEIRVDRGKAACAEIGDGDGDQPPVLAELDEARRAP